MNQPHALSVDNEELLARAAELEAPIPPPPSENPTAPSSLEMAKAATKQLGLSADNVRRYLSVGIDREWPRLAKALRKAAGAYESVDDNTADALNNDGGSAPVTAPLLANEASPVPKLGRTPRLDDDSLVDYYQELKDRAFCLEQTDMGDALDAFAQQWDAYGQTLVEAQQRFRPFARWDSDASEVVEQNFNSQRTWLASIAESCVAMARQARELAAVQRWAFDERTGHGVSFNKWTYAALIKMDEFFAENRGLSERDVLLQKYKNLQKVSDETMEVYRQSASPTPVNPPMPPTGKVDLPSAPSNPGINDGLSDLGGLPSAPSMPSIPTLPKPDAGLPADLTDALADASPVPSGAGSAGLKPASVGAGVPSMPLQPPVEAGSVPPAAAGRDLGGLGRGVPGGAMGAGGMGMPPAGAGGGKGQGGTKGKRLQSDDESLYTEERAWTPGVIGRRRPPKDNTDKDDD